MVCQRSDVAWTALVQSSIKAGHSLRCNEIEIPQRRITNSDQADPAVGSFTSGPKGDDSR